ncbi:hypothetical protein A0H81_10871 [Grifola frondosa]|uniref:Uncharacterized protein n=1 Tax=Grifola frondosa TaxID=5627 RepID=A0A1C7LWN5_GRIFR|nr:hypothetical protein A0H81_10871 [Grifola frondosa]
MFNNRKAKKTSSSTAPAAPAAVVAQRGANRRSASLVVPVLRDLGRQLLRRNSVSAVRTDDGPTGPTNPILSAIPGVPSSSSLPDVHCEQEELSRCWSESAPSLPAAGQHASLMTSTPAESQSRWCGAGTPGPVCSSEPEKVDPKSGDTDDYVPGGLPPPPRVRRASALVFLDEDDEQDLPRENEGHIGIHPSASRWPDIPSVLVNGVLENIPGYLF